MVSVKKALVLTLVTVGIGWLLIAACYDTTKVPPPCTNIMNCGNPADVPPLTVRSNPDGGACTTFRVDIDRKSGVEDDAGVWHYKSRTTATPCTGGSR